MTYPNMVKAWIVAVATSLFVAAVSVQAQPVHPKIAVPENIPRVTTVSAEEVVSLAGRKTDLVIIDSRVMADRKQSYIEGSVWLSDEQTSCKTLSINVANKSTPVLFYCNGVKCGRSVVAIKIAQKCGYKNIYWFRGGMEEWLNKRLPTAHN